MRQSPRITIIGGGVSGALVAAHLLRTPDALEVAVIEPESRLGSGLAFGRCEPFHLLNVPAGRMSAFPDDPLHFQRWLEQIRQSSSRRDLIPLDLGPDSFVPRLLFGEYVEEVLATSRRESSSSFRHLQATALDVVGDGERHHIRLSTGETVPSDILVLALGNISPTIAHPACRTIVTHPRYSGNIWSDYPWRSLDRNETILFIGTGLTMVDGVLAFVRAGHAGKMIALSRRGLLPAVHRLGSRSPEFIEPKTEKLTLRSTIAAVRAEVRAQQRAGVPWQAVIDSLRRITPDLWSRFSDVDRRRFLRHVKSYWETNRHRLAPELHREIVALTESGQLTVRAGNLMQVTPTGAHFTAEIRPRGALTLERIAVDRVVNCTGPEGAISPTTSPLFRSLFEAGSISTDPLHLGLCATPTGFVLDSRGIPSTSILTLGPLLRGMYWETTAVPEIRVQAATIAKSIIDTTNQ